MNLELLRKSLKKMQDGLAEFETKATADEATAADVEALEKAVSDIEATERKIAILEKAQSKRAAFSKPADAVIEDDDEGEGEPVGKSYAQPKTTLTPRKHLEMIVGGMLGARQKFGFVSHDNVMKSMEPGYAKILDGMFEKNLNTGSLSAGGYTIPNNLSNELIPLLYRKSTFKAAGPQLTEMPNGNFLRSGMATGASAAYRGEAATPMISHATFRQIDMKAKLLAGVTSITDQMKRWSNQNLVAKISNDLETATSLVYDQHCYVGPGGANVPLGIFNIAGIPTVTPSPAFAAATTPTVHELDALGRRMEAAQGNVYMPYQESTWVMSFRQKQYMTDLRLPNSDELAYPTMSGANPRWRDKPVVVTFQIPTNLGGTTDETFMGLVHFPTVLDGQSLGLSLKMSDVATYDNGTTVINAWSQGVTLFMSEIEHDLEIEYTQTVVKSSNIRIGA